MKEAFATAAGSLVVSLQPGEPSQPSSCQISPTHRHLLFLQVLEQRLQCHREIQSLWYDYKESRFVHFRKFPSTFSKQRSSFSSIKSGVLR